MFETKEEGGEKIYRRPHVTFPGSVIIDVTFHIINLTRDHLYNCFNKLSQIKTTSSLSEGTKVNPYYLLNPSEQSTRP